MDGELAELATPMRSGSCSEGLVRLWLRKPGCVRVEEDVDTDGRLVTATSGTDGSAWFEHDPEYGLVTSADHPRRRPNIGYPERYLFDACEVLNAVEIIDVREAMLRGVSTMHLRARPGASLHATALYAIGFGADAYSIDVDCERPVLLRAAAELDGRPFEILEVQDVVFDETLSMDLFRRP